MNIVYTSARAILNIAKWLWTAAIIPLILALISALLPLFVQSKPGDPLYALLAPGPVRTSTLLILAIIFGVLLLVPLICWLILLSEGRVVGNRTVRKYLHRVVEAHQGLNPRGFAQQTALISVNVPLDDIFIQLNAVSDRPIFDMPYEQRQLLAELRRGTRADLTLEQQQELIEKLRVRWHSQLGQEFLEARARQQAGIEDVLRLLKQERPVAVILGQPGSGKSTTMRWFALRMARASLSPRYTLADSMAPRQIPLLVRISDYAKHLAVEDIPFRQFLVDYLARAYPELSGLPQALLNELQRGRCLVLFDGLDEVASDNLRRRVAENIAQFIADYEAETKSFNRFIVTSRIVGYEAGTFNRYAHYTLLDLQDEQIEQFLRNWCPAVERYQAMAAQGMKPLTPPQEQSASKAGAEQRDRLLEALNNNPGIKRLAVNPLMLTILALIQRSGRRLPQRRIELYQVVTRTMLDNWNQEKGKRIFSPEEMPLAEQLLSELAYRLHSSDPLLSESDVKRITADVMDAFYQRVPGATREAAVREFIDTLRGSSGLFVESGQGLFSFMHRTFQEYYTARYLLRQPPEELKRFVERHYTRSTWHEPLLLAIADISTRGSPQERQQASDLIETVASAHNPYEDILHRALLLSANCVVDCSAWSIGAEVQQRIANRLFDLYGDPAGICRYTKLQTDVEKVALAWLRGQPPASQLETPPPLLAAWRVALCNQGNPVRQQGATRMLASLAPDLPTCPPPVIQTLLAPLLHLARVRDWYQHDLTCPPEIRAQLAQYPAMPAGERTTEYALVALRLLDVHGPAGWLHRDWLRWSQERPDLLERLTRHSLELDYLLTPATFPARSDDPNWDEQLRIGQFWNKIALRDAAALQKQLLRASDTARYPQAYLLKRLLEAETTPPMGQSWRFTWDDILRSEMAHGHPATYQVCLEMRLVLWRDNDQQRKKIADELMKSLATQVSLRQTLIAIYNQYLLDVRDMLDMQDMLYMRYIPYMRDTLYMRYIPYMQNLLDMLYLPKLRNLRYTLDLRDMLNMRNMRDMLNIRNMRDMRDISSMRNALSLQNLQYMLHLLYLHEFLYMLELPGMLNLLDMLDLKQTINRMLNLLIQSDSAFSQEILFTLYSTLGAYDNIHVEIISRAQACLQQFASRSELAQPSALEQRRLVMAIEELLGIRVLAPARSYPIPPGTADEKAMSLDALKQRVPLSAKDIREILEATQDGRYLTESKWRELTGTASWGAGSVGQFSWGLLAQPLSPDKEAQDTLVLALGDEDALTCAAAALILQRGKGITRQARECAAEKIAGILRDEELSRRSLAPPDHSIEQQLDDVLFETLRVMAEG